MLAKTRLGFFWTGKPGLIFFFYANIDESEYEGIEE